MESHHGSRSFAGRGDRGRFPPIDQSHRISGTGGSSLPPKKQHNILVPSKFTASKFTGTPTLYPHQAPCAPCCAEVLTYACTRSPLLSRLPAIVHRPAPTKCFGVRPLQDLSHTIITSQRGNIAAVHVPIGCSLRSNNRQPRPALL